MTVLNPPGFLQNAGATHTAEQMRNWHSLLAAGRTSAQPLVSRGGVRLDLGNGLLVQQAGSPNMTVVVRSGVAGVPGSEGAKQGMYSVLNDADVTLAIAAAHASLGRIDLVCFKVEDQAYSGAVNTSSLVVVTGTPAGSPGVPAAPNNSIALAQVFVGPGVTSIVNANITDTRPMLAGPGGLISVKDQTERDALQLFESLAVYRRDTDGLNYYDGSAWRILNGRYRATQTLGAPAASVVFSSIPSSLKRVRIRFNARSAYAGFIGEGLRCRINGSASSVYSSQNMQAANTGAAGIVSVGTTYLDIGVILTSLAPANRFTIGECEFFDWSTTRGNLLGRWSVTSPSGNSVSDQWHVTGGGLYNAAGPYTSITFVTQNGANFDTGTTFFLEGDYE